MGRKGLMFITSPEGETTKAGYWMDFPEKSYGVSDKEWKAMPVAERAKIEVEQQANAYASLKQQFREYKDPAYDASKDPEIKPRNFRDSARASNREEVYA